MTATPLTRRRLLAISAALPLAGLSPRAQAAAPIARWRGIALGASATIQLAGLSQTEAQPLFEQLEQEILRLEDIFSLYRPASALSRTCGSRWRVARTYQ